MLDHAEISKGWQTQRWLSNYIQPSSRLHNNKLLNDEDIVPVEILNMHDERYHSREVSRMTALRWVHKLGFKWADSSVPFCDRHEDKDVVAYRKKVG